MTVFKQPEWKQRAHEFFRDEFETDKAFHEYFTDKIVLYHELAKRVMHRTITVAVRSSMDDDTPQLTLSLLSDFTASAWSQTESVLDAAAYSLTAEYFNRDVANNNSVCLTELVGLWGYLQTKELQQ